MSYTRTGPKTWEAFGLAQRLDMLPYRVWFYMREYGYSLADLKDVPIYKLDQAISRHERIEDL